MDFRRYFLKKSWGEKKVYYKMRKQGKEAAVEKGSYRRKIQKQTGRGKQEQE